MWRCRYGKFNIINLNAGCPSGKAKKMRFGAQLMRDPERVRMILHEMGRRAPNTTISVKVRGPASHPPCIVLRAIFIMIVALKTA